MRRFVLRVPFEADTCSHVVEILVTDGPDAASADVRQPGGIWQPLSLAGGSMREEID